MTEKQTANGILLTLASAPLPDALADPIRERWSMDGEDDTVDKLLARAASIANAGAFLRPAKVASVEGNCVVLENRRFESPLLAQKLHTPGMTAVGYVATCGRALYNVRSEYEEDLFLCAIWDEICVAYLRVARDMLQQYVMEHLFPSPDGKKRFASLNPGSLIAWPIKAQKDLFAYLEEGPDLVGVELTASMLMLPTKSSSGIFFPTDKPYENCMHCPRITCPGRRAPYQGDE